MIPDMLDHTKRFYGRRHGKRLKEGRLSLMRDLLPKLELKMPETGMLDLPDLFPHQPSEIWLEVGFGGGEHLAGQARTHPNVGFIGAEPFINGVASLLGHLAETPDRTDNVRIVPDDIRPFFPVIADQSLDKIFVLYPDPWPKARHEDRRFLTPKNLPDLARMLKPGGELRVATDVADYATWAMEQIADSKLFTLQNADHIHTPPMDWISTRYEKKGLLAGRKPTYLTYVKKTVDVAV